MEIDKEIILKVREDANKFIGPSAQRKCNMVYFNCRELVIDFAIEILQKYAKDVVEAEGKNVRRLGKIGENSI